MSGTKQIRLGKVIRFIECLETELLIQKDCIEKLSLENPERPRFEGQIEQLETTISQMKRWFEQ